MKTLGIIGGTGPESTVEYYQRLIAGYRARRKDGRGPSLIINSVDNKRLLDGFTTNELDPVIDYLAEEIKRLGLAGAGLAIIAANTPHLVFDAVRARTSIPMLSIVEATADAAVTRHLRRLALFGTKFTMQAPLFPEAFARRKLTIIMPEPAEQEFIHEKYMNELFFGSVREETRAALLEIVERMKTRNNIDGLILGGTELSLILREKTAAGVRVLDTTQIHVEAALDWLLAP